MVAPPTSPISPTRLGLEVDDLLPLVDALLLLGFADLRDDRLELTGNGQVFAGASIQDSKEIFARASLDRAPLVRTIYRGLRAHPRRHPARGAVH